MGLAGWIAKFGKKKHGKFLVVSVGVIAAIMFILVLPYLMFLLKNLDFYLGFGDIKKIHKIIINDLKTKILQTI